MTPFPLPSVRLALRSPALAAGVAALLGGSGLNVVNGGESDALGTDVLVVDDAWLADPDALAAELEGGAGVVALGSDRWPAVLRGIAPGGWAALGPDAGPAELLAGVLAAAAGLAALPPEAVGAAPPDDLNGELEAPSPGDVTLTPRERDVLARLAEGLSNKRIARELGVSESTVKFHVQALYSKLGVQSRAGAVARGVQLGLISV